MSFSVIYLVEPNESGSPADAMYSLMKTSDQSHLLWKPGNVLSPLKTKLLRSSRAGFLPCLICKHLLNLQDLHLFMFLPCVGPGACVMQINDLEVLARRFAIKVGLNIGVLTDEK